MLKEINPTPMLLVFLKNTKNFTNSKKEGIKNKLKFSLSFLI